MTVGLQNHVEPLLIFLLPMYESLQLFPGLLNVLPCCMPPLFADKFVVFGAVQVHFLLLFVGDKDGVEVSSSVAAQVTQVSDRLFKLIFAKSRANFVVKYIFVLDISQSILARKDIDIL